MRLTSVAALGVLFVTVATALPHVIPIGGLFHPENHLHQHIAFKYAVDRINMDNTVLQHSTLVPYVVNVSEADSFTTGRRVCNLTAEGVAAVFGPTSETTAGIVKSICATLEIPNLETHWVAEPTPSRCFLNLHPDAKSLAKAVHDVVQNLLHWRSFVVLYEHDEGLMRVQELLKAHGPSDSPITVRQLAPDKDYRPLLKEIKKSTETHIVLDCDADHILDVLRQAKEIKMLTDYFGFFVTTLDAHTIDWSEFSDVSLNVTALRLVDPARNEVQYAVHDWVQGELRYGHQLNIKPGTVKTETALMYDAVHLFARALHQLDTSQHINIKPLSCDGVDTWPHGFALRNFMTLMQTTGMTGLIKFDQDGRRSDFNLDVIEFTKEVFLKVATWDLRIGINQTRSASDATAQLASNLRNKTLIVSSRIGPPFLEYKQPREGRVGNDRYEGYSMDLIQKIADINGFKFEFHLAADKKYGSYDPVTKKWDGLVKDLLDRKADLALCDLTITYERQQAVDFTMPFMTLGISILYSKPMSVEPALFSFMDPLSIDVWLYMATAYLGVSVLLFILARLNPSEWSNPHPCDPDPDELENSLHLINSMWFSLGSLMGQGCDILPKASPTEWSSSHPCLQEPQELGNKLTMLNSLWHNVGSLMQQGSDIAPQAVSTRMVAGMWWFFTLIMISSYTANLAAVLTVTRMDAAIGSVDDLAKQTKIKYGAVYPGSTANFFKNSNHSTYQRMWSSMEQARPSVFVKSNSEGTDRVIKGKRGYAFIMESTAIEFATERNCNLTQIGGQLDSKGYGIAMPLGSPYRTLISGSVLKLQENGGLDELKKKWWKTMYNEAKCSDATNTPAPDSTEMGLANVGGVFIVLACGCGAAFVVSIIEFLWNCRKIAVEEAITPWEALVLEVKFAIRLAETKPIRKKPEVEPDKNETSSSIRLDYDKFGGRQA